MPYSRRDSHSSGRGHASSGPRRGGKSFGGGGFHKSSFGGHGAPAQLYQATCSQCGDSCEVPFRPNGKKPVLCRDCFKRDGGDSESKRFDAPRGERFSTDSSASQMKAINMKLDAILKILKSGESDDFAL